MPFFFARICTFAKTEDRLLNISRRRYRIYGQASCFGRVFFFADIDDWRADVRRIYTDLVHIGAYNKTVKEEEYIPRKSIAMTREF